MKKTFGVVSLSIAGILAFAGVGCFDLGGLGGGDDSAAGGGSDSGSSDGGASQEDAATSNDGATIPTVPPTHAAGGVRFVDVDPNTGTVGGVVVISRAADESDVASYVVYLTDASGDRIGPALGEVSANGSDLTVHVAEGSTIPNGVTDVLVVTKNAAGEMTTGRAGAYADAILHYVTLDSFYSGVLGYQVRIQFDAVNRKLILLSGNGVYFYCNLDGTSCTEKDVTNGHEFYYPPKPQIDLMSGHVLIAAQTYTSRTNTFVVTSTLDGTASPAMDVTDPTVPKSGTVPASIVDPDRNRLYVVPMVGDTTAGTNLADTSVLYDCDLGVTGCSRHDVAVGTTPEAQAAEGGLYPSLALDRKNHHLIVATQDESNGANAFVLVCPTAGGACSGHANVLPTSVWREQSGPTPIIDTAADKLLIVHADTSHSPQFVRCELDGTLCSSATSMTSATGLPDQVVGYLRAVGDPVERRVVAVGLKGTSGTPQFFRCGMDGNGCSEVDLIPGNGTYQGADIVTDPVTGQAFVVAQTNNVMVLAYMQ